MKRVLFYSSAVAVFVLNACNAQKSVEPGARSSLPIGIERIPDTTKTDTTMKAADTMSHLPDTLMTDKP